MNDLVATKGQLVTCENGHEVCEIATDIRLSDLLKFEQFTNFRFPVDRDAVIPACPTCGGQFLVSGVGGARAFIEGKWVPN